MSDLKVRRVRFDLAGDDIPFNWHPQRPAFAMQCNVVSFFAPGFEKLIVQSTREALPLMRDPEMVDEATDYIKQEGQHTAAHLAHLRALADLVGIAPSTCHGRVRRLTELGVIRGFYADIDPAAIGLTLQAMISVSLQANARGKIRNFIGQIRRKPQVMDVYFLAGADDFILHVAARDTDDLRAFVVDNLNADADVAGTQTSLIFEHLRGASPL